MIGLKKIESEGFYLLKGIAAANTLYFEDKIEKLKFQELGNYYIGSLMEIREYCLASDSWVFVIKLKDRRTISKHFEKLKINSPSRGLQFRQVWEKISEAIRMWLNHYSRWANMKRGRVGSLVGSPYQRYFFESGEEAIMEIEKMREMEIEFSQPKRRFRPNMKNYKIVGMKGLNSWLRTSKMVQLGEIGAQEIGLKCLYIWELSLLVASSLVEKTLKIHNFQNSTKSSPAPS